MRPLFYSPDRWFYTLAYGFIALPLVIFLAIKVPAFQVPDETSHFARAYQISHGEFFPTKRELPNKAGEFTVGGTVDQGIFDAFGGYRYLVFAPDVKVDSEKAKNADSVQWGNDAWQDTRNVSVYPPVHYCVSALGIVIGKSLNMTITETLKLSRLMNGLIAALLIMIALFTLKRGAGIFFVVLMLPMSLSQIASTSQDAICIASAALCVAFISHINDEMTSVQRRVILTVSSILLLVIATARPPYIALALFYLYYAFLYRKHTHLRNGLLVAFMGSLFAVILWSIYVAIFVSLPFGPEGVDYKGQALFILHSPIAWLRIFIESWLQQWDFYAVSFVANLGHLDTSFPSYYYGFAALTLFCAFLAGILNSKRTDNSRFQQEIIIALTIITITVLGIYAALYISWSPLKNPIIEGVQGRYFIPVALFLGLCASRSIVICRRELGCRLIILSFAITTFFITPFVIFNRYY